MYTVRAGGHTATKCVGGHANRFFTLLRHWANRSVESVSVAQVSAPLTEDTAWLGIRVRVRVQIRVTVRVRLRMGVRVWVRVVRG